jgi:hypothetical protein
LWQALTSFIERQTRHAHNPEDLLANYRLLMRQRWALQASRCRTATCYSLTKLVQRWYEIDARDGATPGEMTGASPFFFQLNPSAAATQGAFDPAGRNWDGAPRIVDMVAEHWATTSVVMQGLARSQSILYVHALQPNPWFRRSTPYVPKGLPESDAYQKRMVPLGYAAFVAKGHALRERGVNFIDTSAVLDDEPSSIYSDDVGHYMPRGYDLLAAAIARALTAPNLQ